MRAPDLPPKEAAIQFFNEQIDFQLSHSGEVSNWILQTIEQENQSLGFLNFIFCSDEYLHHINLTYLQHDTLTDVITFPYSDQSIEGDVFISIERVEENAAQFKVSFEQELYRVIIHGTLHLLGFRDKSEEEQKLMRSKEEEYLSQITF